MKDVGREFRASEAAVELLQRELDADPAYLYERGLGTRDADRLRERLEGTYLLRLFAVFEAGVREAWAKALHQTTQPTARQLVESIAARRTVPKDLEDEIHAIRRFRNSLIHGGDDVDKVSFDAASGSLNKFFARLPSDW